MPEYWFILGAPNNRFGVLSPIARARAEVAAVRYLRNPHSVIIATGGYGQHFNTTATPHRDYVNAVLGQLGVPASALEHEGFLTGNTVEDMLAIADFAARHRLVRVGIITSAFHAARCRLIATCLLRAVEVEVEGAEDPVDLDPKLIEHESAATARLRSQGGVIVGQRLYPFTPSERC